MPIYEYICLKCKQPREVAMSIPDYQISEPTCDVCSGPLTRKFKTAPAVQVK